MSAESPRHSRTGGPLTVPSQPPTDRGLIDAVSGFINDVTLSASSATDPKDVIQWARFETADINEPTPEGDGDGDLSPLLLILGYGAGVQVWLIPPSGEAQEVLSWRQGTVRVLRILPSPQHGDCFASKRPLIALCDSASPGPAFCSLSFISIRGGEQVKSIKFKNPILDVLANKRSVVVAFSERFAVFDAGSLEDRMAITTCYPCPCPLGGSQPINPLALGDRWLAYADKKLHPSKRSSGGCEGEGVTSYTATVLHAAKSLSKGLRGLGESVAQSLAGGGRSTSQSPSPTSSDVQQAGVVTILDIEGNEYDDGQDNEDPYDPIVAHFLAHSEAIIALKFDASGMLLVTADRRGHDFHVFRINPHPCGPSLASVHHLYILHRGDTTAKVQDIAISADSRWTAITTLRGTTHVFAISPYGGACGVRTHTQPRVVNRLSRFHRSAGLPIHATAPPRSGSPVSECATQGAWFPNPRLPPYPLPSISSPLAQLRPTANLPTHTITRTSSGRQRLSSLSEDSFSTPLPARARFGLCVPSAIAGRAPAQPALYLLTHSGCLLLLVLHARAARNVPKEKVCDETPIEVEVEPVAQWALARPPNATADLLAPLPPASPLLQSADKLSCADMCMSEEERWLSQVEIVTHAGPHRRLWMGPQFVFKTYNSTGSSSSLSEAEAVEVEPIAAGGAARSNPVNMPGARPVVPVLIDSGSASSLEHSPSDSFRRKSLLADSGRAPSVCDVQLREDLAEAMKEDHGSPRPEVRPERRGGVLRAVGPRGTVVPRPPEPDPPAPLDPDLYTRANDDEGTFRPVLRAPAALPVPADMVVRPLPRDTTIPVLDVGPLQKTSPDGEPMPLNTDVVIPAALTKVDGWSVVPDVDVDRVSVKDNVHSDLERRESDVCERDVPRESSSADTERASVDIESLPKSNRPSDDIQPIVRARVKKSPTPKSVSDRDSDVRIKKKSKEEKEIKGAIKGKEFKELKEPKDDKKEAKDFEVVDIDDKVDVRAASVKKEVGQKTIKAGSPSDETRDKPKKVAAVDELSDKTIKDDKTEILKTTVEHTDEKSRKSHKTETVKTIIEEPREKSKSITRSAEKSEKKEEKTDVVKKIEDTHEASNKRNISTKEEKSEIELKPWTPKQTDTTKTVEETPEKSKKAEKTEITKTVIDETREKAKKSDKTNMTKNLGDENREKIKKFEKPEKVDTLEEHSRERVSKRIDTSPIVRKSTDQSSDKLYKVDKPEKSNIASVGRLKKGEEPEVINIVKEESRESSNKADKLEILKTEVDEVREKSKKVEKTEIVKTEDQAWDLLLSESEKPAVLDVVQQTVDKFEDKPKSKKNRKGKKGQEDLQSKEDEDSFVEIHAIEEAKTPSCGELVSISTPFEDIDSTSSYLSKVRKPRSSKSLTPEKDYESEAKPAETLLDEEYESTLLKMKNLRKNSSATTFIDAWPEPTPAARRSVPIPTERTSITAIDNLRVKHDITTSEIASGPSKESTKSKKSKSLSPYSEASRKHVPFESEKKDVYVIDSTTDEFPEIQITRGTKSRKKSPQPLERKSLEKETPPIKSWSSIAAAKSEKKEETPTALQKYDRVDRWDDYDAATSSEYPTSSKSSTERVSLQDKLMELCKRRDIMVAECDAPTELHFVDEHHTDLHDLPPLEPLDFGLDDYKLEVMRDSLLDVNDPKLSSPICKINIDDILSSIKGSTTSKVIESSMFNLVDVVKVPDQKEQGFSVVETPKITTQEVKIDDEKKAEGSIMEKSSDDENASLQVSTDSDKEDKKTAGASSASLPPVKQPSKAKKSRRKKK